MGASGFLVCHRVLRKNDLKDALRDTTAINFSRTLNEFCCSFTELARRAPTLMPASAAHDGHATFGGSTG